MRKRRVGETKGERRQKDNNENVEHIGQKRVEPAIEPSWVFVDGARVARSRLSRGRVMRAGTLLQKGTTVIESESLLAFRAPSRTLRG